MNASVRWSLCGVAAAGVLGFVSAPAQATLQILADVSGTIFACADNAACDLNPATGIIQIANGTLNGVQVNGSIQTSTGTPANPGPDTLNTSSLSIINTTDTTKTVDGCGERHRLHRSGRFFPDCRFRRVAERNWLAITMKWFDDPANGQGADTPTDTPGNLIDTFTHTAALIVDSFSRDGIWSNLRSGTVLDD